MESIEKKTESKTKAATKPSAATPEPKPQQVAKGQDNERLTKGFSDQNKNFEEQLQVLQKLFERQNEMIEKQNRMFETQNNLSQDLKQSLREVLQKCNDWSKEPAGNDAKEDTDRDNVEYNIFRSAYSNLAQRNTSRKNDVFLEVPVSKTYENALANLEKIRNINR